MDSAFNNLQMLICHKTQTSKQTNKQTNKKNERWTSLIIIMTNFWNNLNASYTLVAISHQLNAI